MLKDHLKNVHLFALQTFDKVKCNFTLYSKEDLTEVISIASIFHDFGKATSFFQAYLENPEKSSKEDERKKRSHGLISAIITYQILEKKYPEDLILPVMGFIIVRKHHGNLEDYRRLLMISDEDWSICKVQAENIDYAEFQEIINDKHLDKTMLLNFQYENFRKLKRKDKEFTSEHYFIINLLYSILLYSDKTDAILNGNSLNESILPKSDDVLKYKKRLKKNIENPIIALREKAFQSSEKTIDSINDSDRILSINVPTGSGKTITSINAALKLCEKFRHDHIIYCLPFTSVIDQNFEVFRDICHNANLPDDTGILLKHHHLTDIIYNSKTDENIIKEYLPNEALHLIESWESRIIVTTFVQFILSLISFKNSSLKKFHRFSNCVIILDEVQSIPHHYWNLIKEMLFWMTKLLNSRIILVTATMPLIFSEQQGEIKELVSGKKRMFEQLNRIELDVTNLKNEKMEWSDFCIFARNLGEENPRKNILFVMNTVRSAQELFSFLTNKKINHKLEYLSAHVIAKHRLKRIKSIKEHNYDKPVVVVSTQLVEAGVDIDLDIVVRDFAPLDNILQTCGRCNRECRDGFIGKVILFSLKDSNDWIPSGIYESFLKQKTKKILDGKSIIAESEFFELANQYYSELQIGGSQRLSEELIEKIRKLKYDDGENAIELNLIDESYTSSVFIELDEEAQLIWRNYQEVLFMESGFEKNAKLKQTRKNLAEYIINVPKRCLPVRAFMGIYRIPHDEVDQYYDPITGFKLESVLPERTETMML